jgi:hypothetical protein
MAPDHKVAYINAVIDSVRDHVLGRVEYMPDNWNQIELCEFIADQFEKRCLMRQQPQANRKRLRDYANAVKVLNL